MNADSPYVIAGASLAGAKAAETLRAVADHGVIPSDSVRAHYADAQQVLGALAEVGVDIDDVTAYLEDHGLAIFDASWRDLGDQLAAKLRPPAGQEDRA